MIVLPSFAPDLIPRSQSFMKTPWLRSWPSRAELDEIRQVLTSFGLGRKVSPSLQDKA